jgi:Flp pilus assembly CpaE family ATPase
MKGPMLAFVVTSDRADPQVARLEQLLAKHGYTIVGKTAIDDVVGDPQLEAHRDSLVLVPSLGGAEVDVERVIRLAGQVTGRTFVIYVTDEISQAQYKALVRTGAADCVGWDSAMREIVEISQRVSASTPGATRQSAATPEARHVVISFLGTCGGSGNTTLALETAACLATAKGKDARSVAIVDLNFERSVMADYLDLMPRLDIDQVMRNPQRLDRYMLDIFTSKHASTLDMFASAAEHVDASTINADVVFALLEHITDLYDIVVLDLPPYRARWVDLVLKDSDLVFVTGLYSVPSVKQVMHELKHLNDLELAPDQVAVIANQCRTTLFGSVLRDGNIDGVLAGRRVLYVQQDWSFALDCVNAGVSMVLSKPRRGICRDIRKIADAALAVRPKPTP